MRKLARTGLGKEHTIGGAEAADLAFEVRPLLCEAPGVINETVPHIDICDAGLAGHVAIERVEEQHVRCRLRTAHRRQADPEHRDALALQHRDHVLDLL